MFQSELVIAIYFCKNNAAIATAAADATVIVVVAVDRCEIEVIEKKYIWIENISESFSISFCDTFGRLSIFNEAVKC